MWKVNLTNDWKIQDISWQSESRWENQVVVRICRWCLWATTRIIVVLFVLWKKLPLFRFSTKINEIRIIIFIYRMGISIGTDVDILSWELLRSQLWFFLWHVIYSKWSWQNNHVHHYDVQFISSCCFIDIHICT